MATKTNEPADKDVRETEPAAVFEKSVLIQNAAILGTTPELMAGALVSVKADTLTKQQAADALQAYLKRPIGKE